MADTLHEYLTPAEVASKYQVDPKTVSRWAQSNLFHNIKIPDWKDQPGFTGNVVVRTPGGHRRFNRVGIEAMIRASEEES